MFLVHDSGCHVRSHKDACYVQPVPEKENKGGLLSLNLRVLFKVLTQSSAINYSLDVNLAPQ